MRFFAGITVFLFISRVVHSLDFTFGDIFGEVTRATTGIIGSIPRSLPTPDQLFDLSKNALIGLPNEAVYTLINQFCTAALNANSLSVNLQFTPKVELMKFILKTRKANISVPLTNPDLLWTHEQFNSSNPLVIFITGWKTNLLESTSEAQDVMAAAYLCRGNINFVVLDTAAYVDTLYGWSAFNTETIGDYVSKAVQKLVKTYPLGNIHLIGHSLGAQICGAAGRHFNQTTKQRIPRITGLDPANPCFNSGERLSGLFRGDAEQVDVIHTNPGCLGKKDAVGDCDFYCNGVLPLQPGSFDVSSSHSRAWLYYAESVYPGNEENFLAKECTSMSALESHYCDGPAIPMGYATPKYIKGNYFLKTNAKSPYGENSRKYYKPDCAN